jgi:hypothetical protein
MRSRVQGPSASSIAPSRTGTPATTWLDQQPPGPAGAAHAGPRRPAGGGRHRANVLDRSWSGERVLERTLKRRRMAPRYCPSAAPNATAAGCQPAQGSASGRSGGAARCGRTGLDCRRLTTSTRPPP